MYRRVILTRQEIFRKFFSSIFFLIASTILDRKLPNINGLKLRVAT